MYIQRTSEDVSLIEGLSRNKEFYKSILEDETSKMQILNFLSNAIYDKLKDN